MRFKKISLLILLVLTLIGCSFSKNSSIQESYLTNLNTSSTSDIDYSGYEYQVYAHDIVSGGIKNSSFTFVGCTGNISSSGSVSPSSNTKSYRIGSNAIEGNVTVTFDTPLLVSSFGILAKSTGSDNFDLTITYNDSNTISVSVSHGDFSLASYTFDGSKYISSLSFTCSGRSTSTYFKGFYLKQGEVIEVTGIETISSIESEINRFVNISSTYQIKPSNATNQNVTISSNDEFVIIVDKKVKITTIGEHYVTITTEDGDYKTQIKIIGTEETILEGYHKLNDIRFTYDEYYQANGFWGCLPSTGDINVLVVPVNFSDLTSIYDFNNQTYMSRLKGAFEGTNEDNTNDYYESLKSFYYKSSYGKLNLNFIYTDVFVPNMTSKTYIANQDDYGKETLLLINDFYENATIDGEKIDFNDAKYDSNDDGYVDGVWFIYNDNRASQAENYWPYVYWYGVSYAGKKNVNISCYANCSVYFTYEDSSQGYDAHTLFHETGHLLGLDDYYVTTNTANMSAIGGLDMMDYNIGDHDAFSKFALGWINPYVVDDDSIITIEPFESSGDAILIPTDSFNDSGLSEYLILEYITPTGLNKFDGDNQYPDRPYYFTESGIRIIHADARMAIYNNNNTYIYLDSSTIQLTSSTDNEEYIITSSNTPSTSYNGEHLVEIITKNNVSTYKGSAANNKSLFKEGDIMDPSKYTSFFTNSKMHDGTTLEYTIEIISLTSTEAKISITKN